jgi:MFS family permease
MRSGQFAVVAAIGATQTIAWASTYYLPAILGAPIAAALRISPGTFFAVFSGALLLSAVAGPEVGRLIDRHGGRAILAASNLVIGVGLVLLGSAHGLATLIVAWTVLGFGIGMGLYDPAFAALTSLYGRAARAPITGITLIAGFASTIGWPATAWFEHAFGWRGACLIWAAVNLVLALPINWLAIPPGPRTTPSLATAAGGTAAPAPPRGAMPILAFFFAATWFVTGAMAAQLPRLFVTAGAGATAAIAAAALVGPAQVAARLVEFGLLRAIHPLITARLAAALHPLGAALLIVSGAPGIVFFALLHGAGNGMITIAKGTLPLALFGPRGYGERNGLLAAPARLTQSVAPFLFGLLLDRFGIAALSFSAGLSLAAAAALFALPARAGGSPDQRGPDPATVERAPNPAKP